MSEDEKKFLEIVDLKKGFGLSLIHIFAPLTDRQLSVSIAKMYLFPSKPFEM